MKIEAKIMGIGIAVLLFCLFPMVSPIDAAVVGVEPTSQTIRPGENFVVSITIENIMDMNADQATLNFDPGAMQATGIVEGEFLKSGGTTIPIKIIDNTTGQATFAYALTTGSVSGSGTLATINFDTNPSAEKGVFNLDLTNIMLANTIGDTIVIDKISNGTVTIMGEPIVTATAVATTTPTATITSTPPAPAPAPIPGFTVIGVLTSIGMVTIIIIVIKKRNLRKR